MMRTLLLSLILALSGLLPASAAAVGPAAEERPMLHPQSTSPRGAEPDSAALHDRARDAQARFERRRRNALPRTSGSGGGGSCDEVVGRFCLRFGGGSDWTPEPEPLEIVQARDDLLGVLADVGRRIPGDPWVKGQRVFYLGEEGRWSEALDVVGRCDAPGSGWKCHALRGYALHRSDRYEEALDEFGAALEIMEGERREDWRDPSMLLDPEAEDLWEDGEDERREVLRRRLWVLADPLYLVPGNDRLSEHFARHASSWIREDARNPYGLSWGWDLTELVVRYGMEVGWERERPSVTSLQSSPVVGHHHPDSRQYVPPGEVFRDPLGLETGQWNLEPERPRTSYAPAYAPELRSEPYQLAVFRRGSDMVVVAGYDLPADTAGLGRARSDGPPAPSETESGEAAEPMEPGRPTGPVRAGLFLVNPDSAERREARRLGRESGGVSVRAPMGRYLASVEVWSPEEARAGRARAGVRLHELAPDVAALSDLLLLEAGPELPESLESAVPRARARLRACAGETVTVGWELYGLGLRRETVEFQLRLMRTDRGFFERTGEWLGLSEGQAPVALEWTEPGPERLRPFFRAVDVTLPEDMETGLYRLGLEVDLSGRSPLRAERRVRVEEQAVCPLPD